jgi:hypothetical protein
MLHSASAFAFLFSFHLWTLRRPSRRQKPTAIEDKMTTMTIPTMTPILIPLEVPDVALLDGKPVLCASGVDSGVERRVGVSFGA